MERCKTGFGSGESLLGFGVRSLGMGGREGCNGPEEQGYSSCSSTSQQGGRGSAYFDVEPYFGHVDFTSCSPRECTSAMIHIVQPRHSPLKDRYISRAADLVSNLQIRQEEKPKKADCEEFLLLYDNGEEEQKEDEVKLRRASSLKSPGSPPHPGEKKIVRFADVLGLDLADVRTFLDEVPKVPRSAFKDLDGVEIAPSPPVGSPFRDHLAPRQEKSVVPLFQQPFTSKDFAEKLKQNSVCLESASVTDPCLFIITGVVRVMNLGFSKSVIVRHSEDNWSTHRDLTARYVANSCDGLSDKFSFTLYAHSLEIGDRLEFALKYTCNDGEFWDNNNGANYSFQCVPQGPPKPITSAYAASSFSFDNWSAFY